MSEPRPGGTLLRPGTRGPGLQGSIPSDPGIRGPLHPRRLRCPPSPYHSGYASIGRLAGRGASALSVHGLFGNGALDAGRGFPRMYERRQRAVAGRERSDEEAPREPGSPVTSALFQGGFPGTGGTMGRVSSDRTSCPWTPPNPPFDMMRIRSPARDDPERYVTIRSTSSIYSAFRPTPRREATTSSGPSRSSRGNFSAPSTPATMPESAPERASATSRWNTFLRLVLDLGSTP